MNEPISMNPEVERKVTRRFRRAHQSLAGARDDLRGLHGDLQDGAGEFAGLLEDASRDFQASWRAVLHVHADSAGVIAANTNAQHIDLLAIDAGTGC